uniref:Uncharacterized protein n=1 Tax=Caenorhabditis japonica TaxID=281687 RepID=A0A8R1I7W4_CAEJA
MEKKFCYCANHIVHVEYTAVRPWRASAREMRQPEKILEGWGAVRRLRQGDPISANLFSAYLENAFSKLTWQHLKGQEVNYDTFPECGSMEGISFTQGSPRTWSCLDATEK